MPMVHREFFPSTKDWKPASGKPPTPIIRASPFITRDGVCLYFLEHSKYFTPNELKNLAKWLFALSHEATDCAEFVLEDIAYDVSEGKQVRFMESG